MPMYLNVENGGKILVVRVGGALVTRPRARP
jgi:hypothetical protein